MTGKQWAYFLAAIFSVLLLGWPQLGYETMHSQEWKFWLLTFPNWLFMYFAFAILINVIVWSTRDE